MVIQKYSWELTNKNTTNNYSVIRSWSIFFLDCLGYSFVTYGIRENSMTCPDLGLYVIMNSFTVAVFRYSIFYGFCIPRVAENQSFFYYY